MKMDNKLRTYVNDKKNGIKVFTTGHWYDFVGGIENNNDYPIFIVIDDENGVHEEYEIKANDWIGILATYDCWDILKALRHGKYEIEEVC